MTVEDSKVHILDAMIEKGRDLFYNRKLSNNDQFVSYYNQVMRVRKFLGYPRISFDEFKSTLTQ